MSMNEFCNCYAIRKISAKITKIYDNSLKKSGLKITQYAILRTISILKSTNLNNLASSLGYNRSTLGRNIKILERKKLINLNMGKDKREVKITVTNDGMKILKVARKCWEKINNKTTIYLGINKKKMLEEILNDKII